MSSERPDSTAVGERVVAECRGVAADRVVLLCIGNPDRGDDGFGPAVARALFGRTEAALINAGVAPENELPRIADLRPAVVFLVDAVHFGGEPGELRVLSPDDLRQDDVSTHAGSMSVLAEFLRAACDARVIVLAAQPLHVQHGRSLTPAVAAAVETAVQALESALGHRGDARATCEQ
jgi:hydrogenase 3 maturation protease